MDVPLNLTNDPVDIEARGVLRVGPNKYIDSRVGILLSVYFSDGRLAEKRRALVECVGDYLSLFSQKITHFRTYEDGKRMRRYDGKGIPAPYLGLPDLEETETVYMSLRHEDRKEPYDPSLYLLMAFGHGTGPMIRPCSGLKAHFPPSFVFADPGRFVDLVSTWCGRLSAIHGSAGLGTMSNPGAEMMDGVYFYPWLKQYPGLEYDAMGDYWAETSEGGWELPRSSNWLTMLGEENLERLGGLAMVKARLPEEVKVTTYEGGAMLQAGPLPTLGDAANGGVPDAYRAVARLIKPIRFEGYRYNVIKSPNPDGTPRVTLEWLRRFD